MDGIVKRFDPVAGHGVIRADGLPDSRVRIADVLGGRALVAGQAVRFSPVPTDRGLEARAVVPGRRQVSPVVSTMAIGVGVALVLMVLAVLFLRLPWILAWLAAVNPVTFAFYWWDKRQARRNQFRTPELTLLGLGLIGGSPGGLLGRWLNHHKTSKTWYRVKFWLVAALQVAALVWWYVLR